MMLGMSLETFTLVHVLISLVGIGSGLVVVFGMINCFVLVAQGFMKVPPLKALAPTQSEPPFLVAQVLVLAIFVVLGIYATKRFRAA